MGEVNSWTSGSSGAAAGLALGGGLGLGGGEGDEGEGGAWGAEPCLEMDIPGGNLLRGVG